MDIHCQTICSYLIVNVTRIKKILKDFFDYNISLLSGILINTGSLIIFSEIYDAYYLVVNDIHRKLIFTDEDHNSPQLPLILVSTGMIEKL